MSRELQFRVDIHPNSDLSKVRYRVLLNGQVRLYQVPISLVSVVKYVDITTGQVRSEFRPPEIVKSDETKKTLEGNPWSNSHPDSTMLITMDKRKSVVGNPTLPSQDYTTGWLVHETLTEFENGLKCDVIINDEKTWNDIKNGKNQVSPGYSSAAVTLDEYFKLRDSGAIKPIPSVDKSPGIWKGQKYTHVQIAMFHNHVSNVWTARQGRDMTMRLARVDGVECKPWDLAIQYRDSVDTSETPMNEIIFDGKKYTSQEITKMLSDSMEKLDGFDTELSALRKALRDESIEKRALQVKLDALMEEKKNENTDEEDNKNKDKIDEETTKKVDEKIDGIVDTWTLIQSGREANGLQPLDYDYMKKLPEAVEKTIRDCCDKADEVLKDYVDEDDRMKFLKVIFKYSDPLQTGGRGGGTGKGVSALANRGRENNDGGGGPPKPNNENVDNDDSWDAIVARRKQMGNQELTLTKKQFVG